MFNNGYNMNKDRLNSKRFYYRSPRSVVCSTHSAVLLWRHIELISPDAVTSGQGRKTCDGGVIERLLAGENPEELGVGDGDVSATIHQRVSLIVGVKHPVVGIGLAWGWKNIRKIILNDRGTTSAWCIAVIFQENINKGLVNFMINSIWPNDAYAITGSDNGLSPGRHQAIIWTNVGILLVGHLGINWFIHFHSGKCIWKYHLKNGAILSRLRVLIHHTFEETNADLGRLGWIRDDSHTLDILILPTPANGRWYHTIVTS